MKRLATGLLGATVVLSSLFLLPPWWFFAASMVVVLWAVVEYVAVLRPAAPGAPLGALLALVPLAGVLLMLATEPPPAAAPAELLAATQTSLLAFGLLLTVAVGAVVLLGRTPVAETIAAFGAFGFGLPYFALAALALGRLAALDPWLLFLGFAIVFLGDTAAYYVGSRIGRHRLAPVVSPKKSWEGAAAGLVTGLAAAAVWSWWRLGEVSAGLLALALATAVAAQLGDLVESLLKRASGVKDSGRSLPGHGGILDRADAVFFALPVLLFGAWLLGSETLVP